MYKQNPFIDLTDMPYIPEIWKMVNINNVQPNYYMVSNYGNVKNTKNQYINPTLINSGYLVYKLYTGVKGSSKDKYKPVLAHRLVLQTFSPNNDTSLTVNHINHNKENNTLWNLNYMTQKENTNDGIEFHHLYGKDKIKSCTFSNNQLILIINELKNGTSYKEILNKIGIEDTWNNRDYIGNIKRGKTYKRQIKELQNQGFID